MANPRPKIVHSKRNSAEAAAGSLPDLIWQAQEAVHSVLGGEHDVRQAGTGEKFWQFREYDPADRPQDIDWRQTAKGDPVFIKQREKQTPQETLFWCAGNAGMDYVSGDAQHSKKEAAQILSLALALLLTRAHEKVGLVNGGFASGRGEKTLDIFAETLHAQKSDMRNTFEQYEEKGKANIVLVSDFLDEENDIQTTIENLAAIHKDGLVLQILDPAELNLPFEGRAIFEAPDMHDHETIENVSAIRDEYQTRLHAHLYFVERLAQKAGWHYTLHRTDKDISDTLLKLWIMLEGGK